MLLPTSLVPGFFSIPLSISPLQGLRNALDTQGAIGFLLGLAGGLPK
jgi:hypothetical protein